MGPAYWFWFWVWLGAVLVVAEILTLGLFMLPFGIGAAASALTAWLGLSLGWQWAVFIGVSLVSLVCLRWYASVHNRRPSPEIGSNRLIGKVGVVTEEIDRVSSSGRARVNREDWRADSSDGAEIPVGTRIVVRRVEGNHLVVGTQDNERGEDR